MMRVEMVGDGKVGRDRRASHPLFIDSDVFRTKLVSAAPWSATLRLIHVSPSPSFSLQDLPPIFSRFTSELLGLNGSSHHFQRRNEAFNASKIGVQMLL